MKDAANQIKWIIEFHNNIPVFIDKQQKRESGDVPFFSSEKNDRTKEMKSSVAAKKRARESLEKLQKAYQEIKETFQEKIDYKKETSEEEAITKDFEDLYTMILEVIKLMKSFKPPDIRDS